MEKPEKQLETVLKGDDFDSIEPKPKYSITKIFITISICIVIGSILFFAIDLDQDELSTITEFRIGTNINNPDTDSDGLIDGIEVKIHRTNPLINDSDDDGLNDFMEINKYKTNPLYKDSDGDSFSDYDEVYTYKTDPNSRTVSLISVTTTPISGNIYINGKYIGSETASKEYSPGTYTITFDSVPYYHGPEPQKITLKPGDNLNLVGTYTSFTPAHLEINSISSIISGISPSTYKFLFNNNKPLLEVVVCNTGEIEAEQVHFSSRLEGVSDWQIKTTQNIKPTPTITINALPNIPENVLMGSSKGTSKTLTLNIDYKSNGIEQPSTKKSHSLSIYSKNAIPLSDASKLASMYSIPSLWYFYTYYITPQDESIRNLATSAITGKTTPDQKAQAIFDELGRLGVSYASDPNDPFGEGIDYVQLPSETLTLKRGDCDDLAVLYASLLESVGVNTKLVHIPHHVFVGYEYTDGRWHVVETTMIRAPETVLFLGELSYFNEASSKGYENWENNKESAKSIVTKKAWELGIRY